MRFHEFRLTAETAGPAQDAKAVCVLVNDCVDAACLDALSKLGVRLVALRRISFNYVVPIFIEVFGLPAAKQDRLLPDDERDTQRTPPGGTPGYATLNLRARYD